jgi:capsular polysaccharide biosynthesis protein
VELRRYFEIIKKRAWLPILLVLLVASGVFLRGSPPPAYSASMRFVVGLLPEPPTGDYYTYDRYYTWLTAEYLIDDMAEVVKSAAFAQAVEETLIASGEWNPTGIGGAIHGSTSSGKLHRILTVTISWGDPAQLASISAATVEVLQQQVASFFALSQSDRIEFHLIDPPSVGPIPSSLTQRLQGPLRILLALLAGVGLTFLLDYLDDTVRSQEEIEEMGIPVLGEIPAPRRFPRLRRS